jgi:hypothetical protein
MSPDNEPHPESWSPEDEPPTREEALAYERFLRVLLKEEGGKVPEALARKYLNLLLDPAFAKAQPRTHAKMLERYHSMMQKDRHMAIARGWLEREEEPRETYHVHIHPPGELPEGLGDDPDDDALQPGEVEPEDAA